MADIQVTSAELKDGVLTVTGSNFTKTTTQLLVNGVDTTFDIDPASGDIVATSGLPPAGTAEIEVWAIKAGIESDHVKATDNDTQSGQLSSSASEDQATASSATGDPQTGSTGSGESPSATTTQEAEQPSSEPFDPGGDVHEEGYKTATPNTTPGDLVEDDLKTTSDVSLTELANSPASGPQATREPDRTPLEAGEHLPAADFRTRVENTAAGDLNIDPRQPYPTGNPPDPQEQRRRMGLPTTE